MQIKFDIKKATEAEKLYAYTGSTQIMSMTGCLGYFRAYFDGEGNRLYHDWFDQLTERKTDEFKIQFNDVVNELKTSSRFGWMLSTRAKLAHFCFMNDGEIFRFDFGDYAYIMRLNSSPGDYNCYIYVYIKEWLDDHMKEAENGIRFIDPMYKDLFKLKDGDKIKVTAQDGKVRTYTYYTCRYIDAYHLEVGSNIYHICEFAEWVESCGATVEPA